MARFRDIRASSFTFYDKAAVVTGAHRQHLPCLCGPATNWRCRSRKKVKAPFTPFSHKFIIIIKLFCSDKEMFQLHYRNLVPVFFSKIIILQSRLELPFCKNKRIEDKLKMNTHSPLTSVLRVLLGFQTYNLYLQRYSYGGILIEEIEQVPILILERFDEEQEQTVSKHNYLQNHIFCYKYLIKIFVPTYYRQPIAL